VPLDRLLAGLVPSEIFPSAHPEALKAQAVTARGEVLAKIGLRHLVDPYHLCAEQHCQVYKGVGFEHPATTRAVNDTRGEVMFRGTNLVDSVYSAVCGGYTEDNDAVWPQPPNPALRGRSDLLEPDPRFDGGIDEKNVRAFIDEAPAAYCSVSSFDRPDKFRWQTTFRARELDRSVNAKHKVGLVREIEILGRGRSGRVKAIRVRGTRGTVEVPYELPIRGLFGGLRSGLFVVDAAKDAKGRVLRWTFTGAGWGHGAGMCQTGAIGRAERGHEYRRILVHYFPGMEIVKLY
jgi:SpoIID/LytB domain protein